MVDETGSNFNQDVYAYESLQFDFSGGGSIFPTSTAVGTTFSLGSGEAPGVLTVSAPDGPLLTDGAGSTMEATGTVGSQNFDGGTFQTETTWDFTAPDGNTYWIAEIIDNTTGATAYISNYSFVEGETYTFTQFDPSANFDNGTDGPTSDSIYDPAANTYLPGLGMRIDDAATPNAPSEYADLGGINYIAWDNADVTITGGTTFEINAGATSGTFTSFDNDKYFSDGDTDYTASPNDLNQIGTAVVGTNSFTEEIYQAEQILLLQDASGNIIKAIQISTETGDAIWVSTAPLDPAVNYTIVLTDGSPGVDNPSLTAGQEQVAIYDTLAVICFAQGTMIRTEFGETDIAELAVGDHVFTRKNGLKAIRWIGEKHLDEKALEEAPNLRPIRIRAGALGDGLPKADLIVSPQHRVLVRSKIAQRMFGEEEVLVAAKHLCAIEGIDIIKDDRGVTYFHMLFDQHEIVIANGAEAESLYPGPEALKSIHADGQKEILELFSELAEMGEVFIPAMRLVTGRESRNLAMRHIKNKVPLVHEHRLSAKVSGL